MQAQSNRPVSGHVYRVERKRGPAWYAKFRLPDGRQVQKKLGPAWTDKGRPPAGYLTKRTAKAALEAILTDARRGTLAGMHTTGATFADAAAEWLRYVEQERHVKASTLREYRSAVEHHFTGTEEEPGWLRDVPLERITARMIEEWRAARIAERRLSRRTLSKLVTILHGILERARKVYGLVANPTDDVERHPDRYDPGDYDFYSPEEVTALVRAADSEQDGAIFLTAAFGGLRRGELVALRWRDVDFTGSAIRVRASVTNGIASTTKGGRVRAVPMVEQVATALAKLGQRERFTGDGDLVFPGEAGEHLDGSALRRRYIAARNRAGLRPIRFHDLRHTFGSLAINRASIVQVQEWLGHADIDTTRRYLHYRERGDEAKLLAGAFEVEEDEQPSAAET